MARIGTQCSVALLGLILEECPQRWFDSNNSTQAIYYEKERVLLLCYCFKDSRLLVYIFCRILIRFEIVG